MNPTPAVNNELTRLIDRMHDAILDTDASMRPAGNLFDVWWALKGYLENRLVAPEEAAWISVAERRPAWDPKADDVLAYTLTGHVVSVHPNRIDHLWQTRHDGEECFYTHWKPLPKGPSLLPQSNGQIEARTPMYSCDQDLAARAMGSAAGATNYGGRAS